MLKIFSLFIIMTVLINTHGLAQHNDQEGFKPHHKLSLLIGHTQVSEGVDESGDRKWLALPSWSINYNYQFKEKWAVGVHTDIITETFKVEEHLNENSNTIIERSKPVAMAIMTSYKPGKHFSYLFGAGAEFAQSADYFLLRIGAEYGYHFNKSWELNACITNDLKVNAYNSFTIGIGITKMF